jgi:dihydroneopterin aldolase
MKDRIVIDGLEVFYRVGVPDAERSKPQRLLLGVVMEPTSPWRWWPDDLATTIDYAAVSRSWGGRAAGLIETVAVEIAEVEPRGVQGRGGVEVEARKFIVTGCEALRCGARGVRKIGSGELAGDADRVGLC